MTFWQKATDFLGLKRGIMGLLSMVILVGMGEKMAERFLPVYLIAMGSSMLWPGFLNSLDNLLSALYSFPGGWLSDRIGAKRALLVFNFLAMAGFAVVIVVPRWEAVIVGSFLFLSWTAISLPASMDIVSKTLPKNKRVMGVSLHSLVRRIPMAVGPILGGIFIDLWGPITGVRVAFMVAMAMALLAIIMQQILIEDDGKIDKSIKKQDHPLKLLAGFSPELKNLLVSDILIRFCEQIPYAYVVLWCMNIVSGRTTSAVSGTEFGILTGIEMTTAILCYIPVAWLADKGGKKLFVLITFINFTLFPIVLMFCHSFWPLVIAFILRGFKEFGEPTRKSLIMDLAPEDQKAAAFGIYYLCRDAIVALSAFAGSFLWTIGPEINFIAATTFGLMGTIWFAVFGKDITVSQEVKNK